MGNIDALVLSRGSVEDTRDACRQCLSEAMAGGGYILGTGDEVPADTKHDNLKAMVDVAHEYGRY